MHVSAAGNHNNMFPHCHLHWETVSKTTGCISECEKKHSFSTLAWWLLYTHACMYLVVPLCLFLIPASALAKPRRGLRNPTTLRLSPFVPPSPWRCGTSRSSSDGGSLGGSRRWSGCRSPCRWVPPPAWASPRKTRWRAGCTGRRDVMLHGPGQHGNQRICCTETSWKSQTLWMLPNKIR